MLRRESKVIYKRAVVKSCGAVKKEVKGVFKKVICGLTDLVCSRIVDERQVESVQGVQICLENHLQYLHMKWQLQVWYFG